MAGEMEFEDGAGALVGAARHVADLLIGNIVAFVAQRPG